MLVGLLSCSSVTTVFCLVFAALGSCISTSVLWEGWSVVCIALGVEGFLNIALGFGLIYLATYYFLVWKTQKHGKGGTAADTRHTEETRLGAAQR